MELLLLYLWLSLESITVGILVVMLCSLVFWYFGGVVLNNMYPFEREKEEKKAWVKWLKRMPAMAISFFALLVLIPNQQQTAVLVAGHYALKLAETPEAGKVMTLLRKKANEYLDEALK